MNLCSNLNLNSAMLDKKSGQWNDAQNIVPSRDLTSSNPEYGCLAALMGSTHPNNSMIIGSIAHNEDIVIFSVVGIYSQISLYRYSTNSVTILIKSQYLGFSVDNPIQGSIFVNYLNERYVVWNDGTSSTSNNVRILNIDNIGIPLSGWEFTNIADVSLLNLFLSGKVPLVNTQVTNGGSITTGAYFFVTRYGLDEYSRLEYSLPTQPVYIANLRTGVMATYDSGGYRNQQSTLNFISRTSKANTTETLTNKQITLSFDNIDTRFKYLEISAVIVENGIKRGILIDNVLITGNTLTYTFQGTFLANISVEEILIPTATIEKCNYLGVADNVLLLEGVTSSNYDVELQQIANQIKIEPIMVLGEDQNTFAPNEVYALYFHVIINGKLSAGYHIPGRPSKPADVALLTEPELSKIEPLASARKEFRFGHTGDAWDVGKSDEYNMGYWENETEVYPATTAFAGLTGKVRHHKIPSHDYLMRNISTVGEVRKYGIPGAEFCDIVPNAPEGGGFPGIKLIAKNINIPNTLLPKIEGYVISYAKRTPQNSTIVGHDGVARVTNLDRATDKIRFNDPALLAINGQVVSANYLRYAYNSGRLATNVGGSNFVTKQMSKCGRLRSRTGILNILTNNKYHLIKINSPIIAPKDNTTVGNGGGEKTVLLTVTPDSNTPYVPDKHPSTNSLEFDQRVYQLCRYTKTCYAGFAQQDLVIASIVVKSGSTFYTGYNLNDVILSGDVRHSIAFADGGRNLLPSPASNSYGLCVWTWSGINIDCKYIRVPNVTASTIADRQFDALEVEKDFVSLNDIKTTPPNNPNITFATEFNKHIYKSVKQAKENKDITFRRFLANDYYVMPSNAGKIISSQSIGKIVYIQCENTLFVAEIKDTLTYMNAVDAYIGNAELFEYPPKEITTSEFGTIGCNSKFGSALTPSGYAVVDRKKGAIYLVNSESITDIASEYVKEFFLTNLDTKYDIDNRILDSGISLVYDNKYDRLILVKNDNYNHPIHGKVDESFVYSFVFKKGWYAKHTYRPTYLINTRNNIYGIINKNNINGKTQVFRHNYPGNFCIFYNSNDANPTPASSYIDVIFKTEDLSPFILDSVQFIINATRNGVLLDDETITKIMAYTDRQCTGLLDVSVTNEWFNKDFGRNKRGMWQYNRLRDVVATENNKFLDANNQPITSNLNLLKNYFDMSIIISNFVVIRFLTDNAISGIGEQNSIDFIYAGIGITKSYM